ncbi:MauE/DoxX family redox-associated membrane protein [Pimelobacter sp. 30-1]|uniref:MauE/DoxX family redox-associated membrane protein n=1 Tax=Pimelobacter sp. 30-1 TaxID=2004991 RepID=UPI001C041DF6|nr:MauE/DoxX family redox-associated membrane protein [Pimelobacter sp. 30-1]MBU2697569.1 hypothetical protein [Pimelobacter sp. 30-1]
MDANELLELLAGATTLALGGVFLGAATAKLERPSLFAATLRDLGVRSERLVRAGALLVPLSELGTGAALVLRPGAMVGVLAALTLALGFAGTGIVAMTRRHAVRCSCWGARSARSVLGIRQVAALPLWLLALALVARPGAGASWSAAQGLAVLAGLVLALLVAPRTVRVVRLAREVAAQRRAQIWLNARLLPGADA